MAPPAGATPQDASNFLPRRSRSFTTRSKQGVAHTTIANRRHAETRPRYLTDALAGQPEAASADSEVRPRPRPLTLRLSVSGQGRGPEALPASPCRPRLSLLGLVRHM